MGRDPEMEFLDEFGQPAADTDRLPLSTFDGNGIVELLRNYGITPQSPKPVFREREFDPIGECRAWRQTGGCTALGARESGGDADCGHTITHGSSGYCECSSGEAILVDCEAQQAWVLHTTNVDAWRKDDEPDGELHWVQPEGEGWTHLPNTERKYWYNPMERRSNWEEPEGYAEQRPDFTCEAACVPDAAGFDGFVRRSVQELAAEEEERARAKEGERRAEEAEAAAADDIGQPAEWPVDQL